MRRSRAPLLVAALTVVGLLAAGALTACQPAGARGGDTSAASAGTTDPRIFPDAEIAPLVTTLPQRSVAAPPPMRLAHGLLPPTNRWFSGLVFGAGPQPVFPLPLSFGLTAGGFAFGLPSVTATAKTIAGGYDPAVTVDASSASAEVTAYDDVSATVSLHSRDGAAIGHVTIAEGSPLVSFTADADTTLTTSAGFSGAAGPAVATVGGTDYALVAPSGALDRSGRSIALHPGQAAVWFPVPRGASAARVAGAISGPLLGVGTGYSDGGGTATTRLSYRAAGGSTVFGALPAQRAPRSGADCSLGTYSTIYGTMTVCSGDTLEWSVPAVTPAGALDLGTLDTETKAAIVDQLRTDSATVGPLPSDTYFGGKALFRLANLLTIARQLGEDRIADGLRTRLATALAEWAQPARCASAPARCFVYDPAMRGVVGLTASFGSDQFNDHHFHYGYFLYAAGALATDDPSAVRRLAPVMNLLAADLATSGRSSYFPERRTFDPYTGHSWASGYSPFADGNNQESSSEAVNAWNGLALWATASSQPALAREAGWMLSAEVAAARALWTDADTSAFAGYAHSIVSLNWGGKRDYATWFSADPNAILGIQLIPMGPVSGYLKASGSRIGQNLAEAAPSGYGVPFGDYLLMYRALQGPAGLAAARAAAGSLPDSAIDDADSRTYLLAWLAARH
ncbi:glycosyl hydrolase [Leifsonia shinshuensis]|uniref:glucan endo-1,3-beta-D-glucosidase n=1 Tax=Leifsonia shinshuensis TaxID=150026 RepID=A0A853CRJ2_9MICO|nr:endoglucanase Acf2 [Leifsonia shinshuensis]